MFIFAFVVSILTLAFVLLPLLLGKEGHLASAASLNSPEKLEAIKEALLRRYLEDEKSFETKAIPELVWRQRRQFIINRYIDASRRLDFLRDIIATQANAKASADASSSEQKPKGEGV